MPKISNVLGLLVLADFPTDYLLIKRPTSLLNASSDDGGMVRVLTDIHLDGQLTS